MTVQDTQRRLEELRAQMTDKGRAQADELEKLPLAQQELMLAAFVIVGAARSKLIDNDQLNDMICAALNFYAASRTYEVLEQVIKYVMQNGDDIRAVKQALATALIAMHEKRVEQASRIDVLVELLRPTEHGV